MPSPHGVGTDWDGRTPAYPADDERCASPSDSASSPKKRRKTGPSPWPPSKQVEERAWVLRCGADGAVVHLIVRANDSEAAKAMVLGREVERWDEPIDTVYSVHPVDGPQIATVSVLWDREWL